MGAATTILAMVTNLMYLVRIREAVSPFGGVVSEVANVTDAIEKFQSIHPSLLILDLNQLPSELDHLVKAAHQNGVAVIAYGPHTNEAAQQAAAAAGCDEVLANSKFVMELPNLMNKYLR